MDFLHGRRVLNSFTLPRNLWLSLNCCVTSQSDIALVRIDRSLIGGPTDFRHIGHLGTGDLSTSGDVAAINALLHSKGEDKFAMPVPANCRAKDVPVEAVKNEV